MNKWISVEDELPEVNLPGVWDSKKSKTMLVFLSKPLDEYGHKRFVDTGYLTTYMTRPNTWLNCEDCEFEGNPIEIEVTHWMPLPEPPKTKPQKLQD